MIASWVGRSKIYLFTQGNRVFFGGEADAFTISETTHPCLQAFEVHLAVRRLGDLGFSPRGWNTWVAWGVRNSFWTRQFETSKKSERLENGLFKLDETSVWDLMKMSERCVYLCFHGKPVILKYLFWICNNQWSLTYIRMVTITASWGVQKLPCSWDVKRSALFSGPAMNRAGDGWISISQY